MTTCLEGVSVAIGNPALWLALYLTGLHFRGKLVTSVSKNSSFDQCQIVRGTVWLISIVKSAPSNVSCLCNLGSNTLQNLRDKIAWVLTKLHGLLKVLLF